MRSFYSYIITMDKGNETKWYLNTEFKCFVNVLISDPLYVDFNQYLTSSKRNVFFNLIFSL